MAPLSCWLICCRRARAAAEDAWKDMARPLALASTPCRAARLRNLSPPSELRRAAMSLTKRSQSARAASRTCRKRWRLSVTRCCTCCTSRQVFCLWLMSSASLGCLICVSTRPLRGQWLRMASSSWSDSSVLRRSVSLSAPASRTKLSRSTAPTRLSRTPSSSGRSSSSDSGRASSQGSWSLSGGCASCQACSASCSRRRLVEAASRCTRWYSARAAGSWDRASSAGWPSSSCRKPRSSSRSCSLRSRGCIAASWASLGSGSSSPGGGSATRKGSDPCGAFFRRPFSARASSTCRCSSASASSFAEGAASGTFSASSDGTGTAAGTKAPSFRKRASCCGRPSDRVKTPEKDSPLPGERRRRKGLWYSSRWPGGGAAQSCRMSSQKSLRSTPAASGSASKWLLLSRCTRSNWVSYRRSSSCDLCGARHREPHRLRM
mmetsp:Transcript_10422/g.15688  ORF Transcript_10422/g.15688 Transcript_10422/m.15688 type:complete len:435 (+) Transcript_10422:2203-3507(+)